jgi:altronate dehydratase small subunit
VNAVLVISERDNVATALESLDAGRAIQAGAQTLLVAETIPRGHKIALCAIPLGEDVVKYGSPIGRASADIAAGTHVHTHNVASTRGRGDLHIAECGSRIEDSVVNPQSNPQSNPQFNPQSAIRNPQ